jgi:hypothetical protein
MSRSAVLGGLVFVAVSMSGCASSARVIRQDANSVVVAIPDNTNTWPFYYQDAAKDAAEKCFRDPVLTTSQRVKVGEQVSSATEVGGQRQFGDVVTSSTSMLDRYEYQLEFRPIIPVRNTTTSAGPLPPPSIAGAPAASLSTVGGLNGPDKLKTSPIPPLLPMNTPSSPAASLPSTSLPGPGPGR